MMTMAGNEPMNLSCFKAYDIRGRLGEELNETLAYGIGRAYAEQFRAAQVVVGRDVRHSSEGLCRALARGLTDGGVDVFDVGLCGTEEIYFATFHAGFGGGIMVTASHNPLDYNGMKLVREGARPVSGDSGLDELRDRVARSDFPAVKKAGSLRPLDLKQAYIDHLLGYVDHHALKPLRVVVNAGNGCAGPVIDRLEPLLPFEMIKINHQPDGNFPNGIPNPLLPENRGATQEAVVRHGADLGIAWDGDFDRCFFFDENGTFIEGYYLVALLAEMLLEQSPGGRIIHDPRLTWNTIDRVSAHGGTPVLSKTGHAFIKERMRHEDAIYGGEMSAHHYFRDFAYCDSGMIPWLLVLSLMSTKNLSLSQLVGERIALFPASGEINFRVDSPGDVVTRVEEHYRGDTCAIDRTDGLSMEFRDWRFNLRSSNTEALLRLNLESRGDRALMQQKTEELIELIRA